MQEQGNDIDELYEAFKPRLAAARRSYMRKRLGALLVVPVVLGATLPWALADDDEQVSQLASSTEEPREEPTPEPAEPKADESAPAETNTAEGDDTEADEVEAVAVKLGFAGTAYVHQTDDGLALAELDLVEGWTAEEFGVRQGVTLVIVLANGEVRLVAYISAGEDGEPRAEIDNVTPEPEPEVETRTELGVGDVGTVVVERDGDQLWIGILSSHKWWEAVVVTEHGPTVKAYFTNDGIKKYVEAWIEGPEILHRTWVDDSAVQEEPKKEKEEEKKKEKEPKEEEPEIQTRKEIGVGDVGAVVVERDGEELWLGVTSSHDWWDAVVVVEHGAEVHAYFTNDGVEQHVRAWIKGAKIKHEIWIVEPEIAAYDGSVTCGFGSVGVLVEGNVARVTSVEEVEGVEATVLTEVGEAVRVQFATEDATWVLEAWGNGEEVLSECGEVS